MRIPTFDENSVSDNNNNFALVLGNYKTKLLNHLELFLPSYNEEVTSKLKFEKLTYLLHPFVQKYFDISDSLNLFLTFSERDWFPPLLTETLIVRMKNATFEKESLLSLMIGLLKLLDTSCPETPSPSIIAEASSFWSIIRASIGDLTSFTIDKTDLIKMVCLMNRYVDTDVIDYAIQVYKENPDTFTDNDIGGLIRCMIRTNYLPPRVCDVFASSLPLVLHEFRYWNLIDLAELYLHFGLYKQPEHHDIIQRCQSETWKLVLKMRFGYPAKALRVLSLLPHSDAPTLRSLIRGIPRMLQFQWPSSVIASTFVSLGVVSYKGKRLRRQLSLYLQSVGRLESIKSPQLLTDLGVSMAQAGVPDLPLIDRISEILMKRRNFFAASQIVALNASLAKMGEMSHGIQRWLSDDFDGNENFLVELGVCPLSVLKVVPGLVQRNNIVLGYCGMRVLGVVCESVSDLLDKNVILDDYKKPLETIMNNESALKSFNEIHQFRYISPYFSSHPTEFIEISTENCSKNTENYLKNRNIDDNKQLYLNKLLQTPYSTSQTATDILTLLEGFVDLKIMPTKHLTQKIVNFITLHLDSLPPSSLLPLLRSFATFQLGQEIGIKRLVRVVKQKGKYLEGPEAIRALFYLRTLGVPANDPCSLILLNRTLLDKLPLDPVLSRYVQVLGWIYRADAVTSRLVTPPEVAALSEFSEKIVSPPSPAEQPPYLSKLIEDLKSSQFEVEEGKQVGPYRIDIAICNKDLDKEELYEKAWREKRKFPYLENSTQKLAVFAREESDDITQMVSSCSGQGHKPQKYETQKLNFGPPQFTLREIALRAMGWQVGYYARDDTEVG